MESSTTKAAKPVETFRLRGISASVFENHSEDGKTFHKVSLQRTYRQGDEWKNTQSLGRDDLPIAAMLLQKAWEYVLQTEGKKSADEPKERGARAGDRPQRAAAHEGDALTANGLIPAALHQTPS